MSNFQSAHVAICALIDDFAAHRRIYLDPSYSESQARLDFIDKFWTALGWDIGHVTQKNPYEQEVRVEKTVTVGGAQKRADYAFHAAPNFTQPVFFVEAKKPAVELGTLDNCFQLVRYAWNAGCALSVLHDFEELLILDCRWRPDKATAQSRIWKRFHYTDFIDEAKLREVYHLFSREAASEGAIAKRAAELPKPKGKSVQRELFKLQSQTLDEAFLSELEEWREDLAKGFKRDNPFLDSETLTEITQRALDRLVFLRFLEDKGIEQQTTVGRLGAGSGSPWTDFQAASRRLDRIYNGAIFHKHSVLDSDNFGMSDDVFGGICERLDAVNSPYDFNVIPIHILGSIYERFLGSVIIATDKRARVEQKLEVRKAGGVYYTPEHIVRYIVEQTVGRQIDGKTPDQIEKMCFADIACGSGSFLLGVFDCLLRYHTKWFNEHPDKAALPKPVKITKKGLPHKQRREVAGDCFKDPDTDSLRLTLEKKRQILLNNVFGTDLDPQAVEVAQLSLYLKLLEDETAGTTHQYSLDFDKEALLPSLERNIVCGNALIGTDILGLFELPPEEEEILRPMDYKTTFPWVFDRGGFDAIVGNPPYGAGLSLTAQEYVKSRYRSYCYKFETYWYFIEKSIALLRAKGSLGYITPTLWLELESAKGLRSLVRKEAPPWELIIHGENVFPDATVHTLTMLCQRGASGAQIHIKRGEYEWKVGWGSWGSELQHRIQYRLNPIEAGIVKKMESGALRFSELMDCVQGITSYDKYRGHTQDQIKSRCFHAQSKLSAQYGKWLQGADVNRYSITWSGEWLKYGPWLGAPREPKFFTGPRILFREIPGKNRRIQAAYADDETFYHGHPVTPAIPKKGKHVDILFVLGIVNSTALSWYGARCLPNLGKDIFPKFNPQDIKAIPLPQTNQKSVKTLANLVNQILEAKRQEAAAGIDAKRDFWARKAAGLDRQIDALVYELYGLTAEEIALVEGRAQSVDLEIVDVEVSGEE